MPAGVETWIPTKSPFPRLSQCVQEETFCYVSTRGSTIQAASLVWCVHASHTHRVAFPLWRRIEALRVLSADAPHPTLPPPWEGSQFALLSFRVLKHYWKGTRDSYLVPQDGLHLQEEHDHTAPGIARGLCLQGGLWNQLPFQMKRKNPSVPGFGTAPPGLDEACELNSDNRLPNMFLRDDLGRLGQNALRYKVDQKFTGPKSKAPPYKANGSQNDA